MDQELATPCMYSPDGSTFAREVTLGGRLESITSYLKSDSCQLMLIYLMNNPAKFHPDPI